MASSEHVAEDVGARLGHRKTAERHIRAGRPPWWWPGWPSLRDVVTSAIALAVLCYTGAVLWGPFTSPTGDGSQHAQLIWGFLGPIVGGIIGYYFGSGSGERVARQATREAEGVRQRLGAARETLLQNEQVIDQSEGALEQVARDLGLDKEGQ